MFALGCLGLAHAADMPTKPVIISEDVARFFGLYEATSGHPTADQLQHNYLDAGSDGLQYFAKARDISGVRIAKAITDHPGIYADARRCLTVLPRVRQRVQAVLLKLGRLYPEAQFPPITIAVGPGKARRHLRCPTLIWGASCGALSD
jgi:hypothetical protein